MTNTTLADEILTIVRGESNNNPPPLKCTVVGNYNDKSHVDIQISDSLNIMKYVTVIGDDSIGSDGIVCFINGEPNNQIVITGIGDSYYTKPEIDDIIESIVETGIDLSKYVKKNEVKMKFYLGTDGYITIGIDVGDGF